MSVKLGFTASEIIKAGRVTKEEIHFLKLWMLTESLPQITEEQIILFLLSCCRDQNATKATIMSFYSVRRKTPELFNNRRLFREDLQKQLRTLKWCVFPKRTEDGCAILYHGLQDTDYRNYDMKSAVTLLFMTLEATFYDHPPDGLIIIYDMKDTSFKHFTKIRFDLLPAYCKYLQECLPIRLKCAHIFNTVGLLYKLLAFMKPFLKDEVKNALHVHPANMDMEIFATEWLAKSHLPEDLGGYLPNTQLLHQANIEKLIEMEPYFDAEERQRQEWINSLT